MTVGFCEEEVAVLGKKMGTPLDRSICAVSSCDGMTRRGMMVELGMDKLHSSAPAFLTLKTTQVM